MKELSIEQKAKRYDESLEQLKGLIENTREDKYAIVEKDIINIFPELVESEDEKVKRIIHSISNKISFHLHDIFTEEEFQCFDAWSNAWLEKQGENMKTKSEVIKDYTWEENAWNNARDFRPKHMQRCLCYDKYMGGVYCYVYDNIDKYWCTQTTEEHDPDGDNHVCDYADYRVTVWMCLPKTSFYPKKQVEQKPADKIEPKFHESDWVVDNECGKVNQITSVRNQGYDFANGDYMSYESAHKELRLWDISDAKDGDVVVDKSDGTIGIFQSIGHHPDGGSYNDPSYCFLHCRYDDGFFYADFENGNTMNSDDAIPATKEQRDTLMKAMADAGYTFDFGKKELKKIEQNLSNSAKVGMGEESKWSDEDEERLQSCISALQGKGLMGGVDTMDSNWLKSLKQRLEGQR